MMRRNAQVWIETVLYTLIGIALIGVVLAFVTPKINEQKDRLLIEQTVDSLDKLDEKVNAVLQAPGNVRLMQFSMKKGAFYVNSSQDSIIFVIDDLSSPYSEPGVEIPRGRMTVLTTENQDSYAVTLRITYPENIVYDLQEDDRKFDATSIPYQIAISNEGTINQRTTISIKEMSGV